MSAARIGGRELALAALLYLFVALVISYPLVLHVTTSLPSGVGDPGLVTYFLAWDADRIAHAFRGFWDAPILYPERHTLAYSEHMLGVALFTAPVQWISGNAVLAYNVAFLGSYVLAGIGMYLLARDLFGRIDVAVLAGMMFAFSPYRNGQTTHLQVLVSGWMPLALFWLHRFFRSGSTRALAGFVIAFVLQALSNGYYLYFFAMAVAALVAAELVRPSQPRARVVKGLTIAAIVIAAALAPFAWAYVSVQRAHGFERGSEDLAHYSAQLADYFKVVPNVWNWGGLLPISAPERDLFLGAVAMGLAVIGLATAAGRTRRVVFTYGILGAFAVWLSLGPGWLRPWGLLYRIVPGFSGMRVPARMVVVADVALVVVAAAGAAWILARVPRAMGIAIVVVLAAIVTLEGRPAFSVDRFPPVSDRLDRSAYEWLRASPPGAAVELRIVTHLDLQPFTLYYQFSTLFHGHPIVNGYTGWSSPLQEFLGGAANPFQEPGRVAEAVRALRTVGVRYVLLHGWTYADQTEPARIRGELAAIRDQVDEERQFDQTWVYRLAPAPPYVPSPPAAAWRRITASEFTASASRSNERVAMAFDGNVETRWLTNARQTGEEWFEIRLRQPADVARVRIETAPRGMVDYPRHLVVESVDERGAVHAVYDGSILTPLIESMVASPSNAPVDLDLPPNHTVTLRIRQTGQTHRLFWSLHELSLWAR